VSASPASGARSRSKRLTSSAAKLLCVCRGTAVAAGEILPPALSEAAHQAGAARDRRRQQLRGFPFQVALSAKCDATCASSDLRLLGVSHARQFTL